MIFLILREPNMSEWNSREGETECNNGSFQFSDLHPGSYNLVVMLSGSGKRQRSARASFDVDNTNIDDVRVIVGAGIDFTGRILVQGHESLDFSEVRLWVNDFPTSSMLALERSLSPMEV